MKKGASRRHPPRGYPRRVELHYLIEMFGSFAHETCKGAARKLLRKYPLFVSVTSPGRVTVSGRSAPAPRAARGLPACALQHSRHQPEEARDPADGSSAASRVSLPGGDEVKQFIFNVTPSTRRSRNLRGFAVQRGASSSTASSTSVSAEAATLFSSTIRRRLAGRGALRCSSCPSRQRLVIERFRLSRTPLAEFASLQDHQREDDMPRGSQREIRAASFADACP